MAVHFILFLISLFFLVLLHPKQRSAHFLSSKRYVFRAHFLWRHVKKNIRFSEAVSYEFRRLPKIPEFIRVEMKDGSRQDIHFARKMKEELTEVLSKNSVPLKAVYLWDEKGL